MYAEVILPKRTPIRIPFFDYLIPKELESSLRVGQLVLIPFRSSKEMGVVKRISNMPHADASKLKTVSSIIIHEPLLTPEQLAFLEEVAELYHTPLGFLIKTNILPLQKRKIAAFSKITLSTTSETNVVWQKPVSSTYQTTADKLKILDSQVGDGQTLILVPEKNDIGDMVRALAQLSDKKVITIDKELSTKDFFSKWVDIWQSDECVVVGTRSALFLPYRNLRTIILDNESNPNHKSWDMAPRTHTKDAVLLLGKHHKAAVNFIQHTASVETYFFAKKQIYAESPLAPQNRSRVEIINMKEEEKAGNYGILSEIVVEEITAKPDSSFFIFLNRRGSSTFILCRDCNFTPRCKNCTRPLIYSQAKNLTVCNFCKLRDNIPFQCPSCGGERLQFIGAGVEKVEKDLRKIFGSNRKIVRIDSDSTEKNATHISYPCIIIGTQLAWTQCNWSKLDGAVFVDADIPLFIPEYKSTENVWFQMHDARYRLPNTASLYIQTHRPEQSVFANLFNPDRFYAKELLERKAFGYPPFKNLVKLFVGRDSDAFVEVEANRVLQDLEKLTKVSQDITILPSIVPMPSFQRGKFWRILVVKVGHSTYKQTTKQILKLVPEDWKVDINPNSLLSI